MIWGYRKLPALTHRANSENVSLWVNTIVRTPRASHDRHPQRFEALALRSNVIHLEAQLYRILFAWPGRHRYLDLIGNFRGDGMQRELGSPCLELHPVFHSCFFNGRQT